MAMSAVHHPATRQKELAIRTDSSEMLTDISGILIDVAQFRTDISGILRTHHGEMRQLLDDLMRCQKSANDFLSAGQLRLESMLVSLPSKMVESQACESSCEPRPSDLILDPMRDIQLELANGFGSAVGCTNSWEDGIPRDEPLFDQAPLSKFHAAIGGSRIKYNDQTDANQTERCGQKVHIDATQSLQFECMQSERLGHRIDRSLTEGYRTLDELGRRIQEARDQIVAGTKPEKSSEEQIAGACSAALGQRYSEQQRMRKSMAVEVSRQRLEKKRSCAPDSIQSNRREYLGAILNGPRMAVSMAVLITSNALFMGLQIAYDADSTNPVFNVIEVVYAMVFVLELLVRIYVEGRDFFAAKVRIVNCADASVILFPAVEFIINTAVKDKPPIGILRLLRVARLCKALRVFKLVRCFRSLRLMALSIYGTLKSLCWALLLLCCIMYTFALVFAQAASDARQSRSIGPLDLKALDEFHGSIPLSMLSLFEAISGGRDWQDIVTPLNAISSLYLCLFIVYISIVSFAVMNVVTGHFCQNAIESAQRDVENVIQRQVDNKERYIGLCKRVYKEIDRFNAGVVTLADFERSLQNEHSLRLLETLEIEVQSVVEIFQSIDADRSFDIDLNEFVHGCLRLRGPAKSAQVEKLEDQVSWLSNNFAEFVANIKEEFNWIQQEALPSSVR